MSKVITRASAQIASPLPAMGTMTMDNEAKLRLELDVDMASLIARAVLTRETPKVAAVLGETLKELLGDLMPKFAAGLAATQALRTMPKAAGPENGRQGDGQ